MEVPRHRTFRWRNVIWVAGVFAVLPLLVLGRGLFGRWCRDHAARDIDVWALGNAQSGLIEPTGSTRGIPTRS